MGHLSPHRPLLEAIIERGHELYVASRCPAKAAAAFQGLDFTLWQAPFHHGRPDPFFKPTPTIAEVLNNSGFDNADALHARTLAWDQILKTIQPEGVLADFTPSLLIALGGRSIPIALLGTGFLIPPDEKPTPFYPRLKKARPIQSIGRERVRDTVNACLSKRGQAPIEGVSDLFHSAPIARILQTYRELDHFPSRTDGLYVGCPPPPTGGRAPEWPEGKGSRVFAYLKASKGLPRILDELASLHTPTIVVTDGASEGLRQKHARPQLHITSDKLDLLALQREANVAVTNGNHATTAQFLMAGVPLLCMPLSLEQTVTGLNIGRMGAGLMGDGDVGRSVAGAVHRLFTDARFREGALAFAQRNRSLPFEGHTERTLSAIQEFLPL